MAASPRERTQRLPEPLDHAALSFARERERALRRTEHLAAVWRLHRALSIGVAVWVASTLLDICVTQFAGKGDLGLLLALQELGALVVLPVLWVLRRAHEPSVRALWACDAIAFTTVTALTSIESLFVRGIDSPYAAGLIVIMLIQDGVGSATFDLYGATQAAEAADPYLTSVCLTRMINRLVQALFAINRRYRVNDKTVFSEAWRLPTSPSRLLRPGTSHRESPWQSA